MSKNETIILSDGRKTSDLKVAELKIELNKLGLRKTGTKQELLTILNEAITVKSISVDYNAKENSIASIDQNKEKVELPRRMTFGVDLDDCDGMADDRLEINQSIDTLELGAPNDYSLNPIDDTMNEDDIQEDDIQMNVSRKAESESNLEGESESNVDDKDPESTKNEEGTFSEEQDIVNEEVVTPKRVVIDNDTDDMVNIDLQTTQEMYDGDIVEQEVDDRDSVKDAASNIAEETIRITIRTKVTKESQKPTSNELESPVVPITARLGKRKVKESESDGQSPRKIKRNSHHETKVLGYTNEEPLRVKSPRRSKYAISDVLRVDHLVRPFTMTQLQDLLSQKGRVLDLWLNRIKSVAYIKYENESAAINARESLDGCKWPSINPKLLLADFANGKEMEWMKEKGDTGVSPPTYLRQLDTGSVSVKCHVVKSAMDGDWREVDTSKKKVEESKTRVRAVSAEKKRRDGEKDRKEGEKDKRDGEKDRRSRVKDAGIRHDLRKDGLKDLKMAVQNDSGKDQDRNVRREVRREKVVEKSAERTKKPPATKRLEDLFRKTVSKPSVYWQPAARDSRINPVAAGHKVSRMQLL